MTDDTEWRRFTRALFDRPQPEATATEPTRGLHVPREGANAAPPKPSDHDTRRFVRELFGYDPDLEP